MRLVFVASNLPSPGHSVRAATVLVREALLAFRDLGTEIALQPLLAGGEPASEVRAAIDWARGHGLETLEPLHVPPAGPRRLLLLRQAVAADPRLFYPAYALRDEVARRVDSFRADAVFHLWSEHALAACSATDRPVFAYYGVPDHKPLAARLAHPDLFEIPRQTTEQRLHFRALRAANEGRQRAAWNLMRGCRWVGNVCALDAGYWTRRGHYDSFYLQNMWPLFERDGGNPSREPGKIAGNLGGLYATGNTFGLLFLGREIVPALERRLGRTFGIHVYGAGEPVGAVAGALDHPLVRRRGFVLDIDGELRTCEIFLLANNCNPGFVGGHTRILHAWSLGSCLVAHRNIALAMPEVVHRENALLGETAEDLAALIGEALEDEDLRDRLSARGRETLEREFTPKVVMPRVLGRIQDG